MSAATDHTAVANSQPRRAPLWRPILAQALMEVRLLVRSSESLVVTLGIPLGILVFFSSVQGILPTGHRDPVDFLVPGVLAISVMSTAFVNLSIQTAFERKYGVLKRLGGTPLPRSAFLAAKALSVGIVLLIQTALVFLIAVFGLGWHAGGSSGLAVVGMLLGTFTFSALGLLMAGALRAEGTLALSNAVYLVLLVVSGLMFSADALPGPMEEVGRALPSGALGVVLRDAFGQSTGNLGLALLVLSAWGLVAAALTARTFRWEP